jgi:hypothetical protein
VEGRGNDRGFNPPLKLEVVASLEGIVWRFNPPLNLEVVASLNWRLTLLWKLLSSLDWRFDPPLNLEELSSLGSHYFP